MNVVNHLMKLLQDAQVMPIVQRLGWMLVHSLWQGAALAILLRIFLAATRWRSGLRWSNIRYAGSCAALALLVACAAATFVNSGSNTPTLARQGPTPAPSPALLGTTSSPAISISPAPLHRFDWQSFIPLLVLVWMAGVLALSARYFVAWLRIRQLQRGESLCHPLWTQAQQLLADRLGIHRVVRLVGSSSIGVPVVIGALKPVIVIPLAIVNCLSPQQVQAILAHELAHVRRHDYLLNLLQTALETLFFYHPAVWWMSAQIRDERENCCDDLAAAACGDRVNYASALVALEERRGGSPRMALAATDGSLLQRVRRLLPPSSPRRPLARANRAALVALICLAMLMAGEYLSCTHAQVPMAAPPDASKAHPPGDLKSVSVIVGKNGSIIIDGAIGNWQTLRDSLAKLPESSRKKICIVLGAQTKDLPVDDFLPQVEQARSLVKDLGLANVSLVSSDSAEVKTARGVKKVDPVVAAQLERRLPDIKFEGNGFSDVIDFLRDVTGANIFVNWRVLEAAGVAKDTPVTIKAKDVKFSTVLQLLLDDAGGKTVKLSYVSDDGVIQISTADDLSQNIAIPASLDRRLPEIKFQGNGFSDVIDFLRDVTGANIFVNWRVLEATGIAKDAPVYIQAKDINFSKALQLILDDAAGGAGKISYVINDGVIRISTVDDLSRSVPGKNGPATRDAKEVGQAVQKEVNQSVITRIYDIRSLVDVPDLGQPPEKQKKREERVDDLIKLIEDIIASDSWKDDGGTIGSIRQLSGQIIVTQTPENQQLLANLLEQLRETRSVQVHEANQAGAAQAQLDRRLPEINFEGNGFANVIDFMRDVTGTNVFVNWRALEAAGIAKDAPVNIHAKDVKFSEVLQLIFDDVGAKAKLSYVIDDGVIRISTADDNKSITKKNGPATRYVKEIGQADQAARQQTQQEKARTIDQLIQTAQQAIHDARYDEALKIIDQILVQDPNNDYAKGVRPLVNDKITLQQMKQHVERDAKEVAQDVHVQLDRRLPEINFQGSGFADVIDFLSDVTGAKISVNWHALEAAGIAKDAPVNIQAKDSKLSNALQQILDNVGGGAGKLSYVIDNGVIRISTADDLNKNVTNKKGAASGSSPPPATQTGQK